VYYLLRKRFSAVTAGRRNHPDHRPAGGWTGPQLGGAYATRWFPVSRRVRRRRVSRRSSIAARTLGRDPGCESSRWERLLLLAPADVQSAGSIESNVFAEPSSNRDHHRPGAVWRPIEQLSRR